MKINLRELTINNFKGIKEQSLLFAIDAPTNIYAANEVGKTTIADAWHWLLTNKNSADEKDFNIKNTVHKELNRADHVVAATIVADGVTIVLKKVFKEKWVKKRGQELPEFNGHETLYYYNDVPCTQAEYQKKIADILDESILKMITNPLYFNSIKWQDRRNVLLSLAGDITNDDVLRTIKTSKDSIENLRYVLNSGKTIIEYKREISSRKKKIKDDLLVIPSRIDEVRRSTPELLDYIAIEKEIAFKNEELAGLDAHMNDRNLAYQQAYQELQKQQNELHNLKIKKRDIEFAEKQKIATAAQAKNMEGGKLTNTVERLEADIKSKSALLKSRNDAKVELAEKAAALRQEWNRVNESEIKFDDHQFTCPTCKREFEAEDVKATQRKLIANFIEDKNRKLDNITQKGKSLVAEINDCDNMIAMLTSALDSLNEELAGAQEQLRIYSDEEAGKVVLSLEDVLGNNDEYVSICAQISFAEGQIPEVKPADVSDLNVKKHQINAELDVLKRQLDTKSAIEKCNKRVDDLEAEEKQLAQQLADLERTEFLLEEFDKNKMDIMESRINGKFQLVKFRLFDRQINGGEQPTCETLYKDVPFSDLNTAGKIQAGLDIINTLSKHYDVYAPVFLDNRESVTNIPDTDSQVINLIVSAPDKVLRVA